MNLSGICDLCAKVMTLENSYTLSCGHKQHACASPYASCFQCKTISKSPPFSSGFHSSTSSSCLSPTLDAFRTEVSHDLSEYLSFKDYERAIKKEIMEYIPPLSDGYLAQADDQLYLATSCIMQKRFTVAFQKLCQMKFLLLAYKLSSVVKTEKDKTVFNKLAEWNTSLTKTVETEIQKYFLY